jgi:5'-phosphate synthase pdxT subunit
MSVRIPGEAHVPVAAQPPGDGPVVGVLALQGDVLEHVTMLRSGGATAVMVKRAEELERIDGLVIPGGESTTIGKLADMYGLLEPLRKAIDGGLPVLGTCAGAILLSRRALFADGAPSSQPLIGALDATTRRNAFGRQVASFESDLDVEGIDGGPLHAVFIRAPWFEDVGSDVAVLASVDTAGGSRAVVVRQGVVMAAAFHPELSGDPRLHQAFVALISAGPGIR